MRIGLLYEGDNDTEAIKKLISRILDEAQIEFVLIKANGPILGKLDSSAVRFFKGVKPCDFAIYLTDQDKDANKPSKIKKWRDKYVIKNPNVKIIVAVPKPTFEQWLILDEDCIKSLFKLNGAQKLPFDDIKHPKNRLKKLALKYTDMALSTPEVYEEIANYLNLDHLSTKDSAFKAFTKELKEMAKLI